MSNFKRLALCKKALPIMTKSYTNCFNIRKIPFARSVKSRAKEIIIHILSKISAGELSKMLLSFVG